jgi:hypothetical protein
MRRGARPRQRRYPANSIRMIGKIDPKLRPSPRHALRRPSELARLHRPDVRIAARLGVIDMDSWAREVGGGDG